MQYSICDPTRIEETFLFSGFQKQRLINTISYKQCTILVQFNNSGIIFSYNLSYANYHQLYVLAPNAPSCYTHHKDGYYHWQEHVGDYHYKCTATDV